MFRIRTERGLKFGYIVAVFLLLPLLLPPHGMTSQATVEPGWSVQKSGVLSRLSSVFFVDRSRGWVVGSNGTLLETDDGGRKWRRRALPERQKREMVRDIWSVKDDEVRQRLYLLGQYGMIDPRGFYNITDRVFFLISSNNEEGWAPGSTARQPVRRPDKVLGRIEVTEAGQIQVKESDSYSETLRNPEPVLLRMFFIDNRVGWTIGESGTIQMTKDGGANWTLQYAATRKLFYDVMATSAMEAWIVGAGGTILHTNNGGQFWKEEISGITDDLLAVHFIDSRRGWAVGKNGTIISTINGGASWRVKRSNSKINLNDVTFVKPAEGWIAGDDGILLHTVDGGETWEEVVMETHGNLNRLFFVAPDCGWVVGTSGVIFKYGVDEN